MTTKQKQTPEEVYAECHFACMDLLDEIRRLLHDQPSPENASWGNVGEISWVEDQLDAIRAFLRREDH